MNKKVNVTGIHNSAFSDRKHNNKKGKRGTKERRMRKTR